MTRDGKVTLATFIIVIIFVIGVYTIIFKDRAARSAMKFITHRGYRIEWNRSYTWGGGYDEAYTSHYTIDDNGCITFKDTTRGVDRGVKIICGAYHVEDYLWQERTR